MIEFAWFWMFLALPLPWLVRLLLPSAPEPADMALRTPFLDDLSGLPAISGQQVTAGKTVWLAGLAWLLLVTAAARPEWLGDPVEQGVSGRDLMLAVDLSGSMEIADFMLRGKKVDRLTATQDVAGHFLERRVGDRLGLILFGETAYLQAPLTFDRKTVHTLLDEAVIGLAGDKTAIGDAIGLAVKRLRDNPQDQRVLILLSDGANTAGTVAPLQAADLAARVGLKVYTSASARMKWSCVTCSAATRSIPHRTLTNRPCAASPKKRAGAISGPAMWRNSKTSTGCWISWNRSSATSVTTGPVANSTPGRWPAPCCSVWH